MDKRTVELLERFGSFGSFTEACVGTATFLESRLGISNWVLTRIVDGNMIVLDQFGSGPPVIEPGAIVPYEDSMCHQLIERRAPMVVPDALDQPLYSCVKVRNDACIRAYVGCVLLDNDGELFGTFLGLSQEPASVEIVREEPLLMCMANLLSTLLAHEILMCRMARQVQRNDLLHLQLEPEIYIYEGWERFLGFEEMRCRTYGSPCGMVSIRCTEGDPVADFLGNLLVQTLRPTDFVARMDDGSWAVLLPDTNREGTDTAAKRLTQAVHGVTPTAAITWTSRPPESNLFATYERLKAAPNVRAA